ncbi:hypothetical protein KC367_g241 [Hortaea werneckii]|nr:hypothetical protein KC367_g241 [Hortaea werneckii]
MNGNLISRTLKSAEDPAPKPRPRMIPSLTALSATMYLSTQHHSCKSVIRMLKPFIVFEGFMRKAVVIA